MWLLLRISLKNSSWHMCQYWFVYYFIDLFKLYRTIYKSALSLSSSDSQHVKNSIGIFSIKNLPYLFIVEYVPRLKHVSFDRSLSTLWYEKWLSVIYVVFLRKSYQNLSSCACIREFSFRIHGKVCANVGTYTNR